MNSDEARTVQTFWLVTVCNKELPDGPDIGLAVSLGSDVTAEELGQSMVDELASAGHGRCVYRVHKRAEIWQYSNHPWCA